LEPAEQDIRGREIRLQVFVRIRGDDSIPKDKRILEVVRGADLKDVELFLPERDEIVSTGWVPEITYKMQDTSDLLQIVMSPSHIFPKGQALEEPETVAPKAPDERPEKKVQETRRHSLEIAPPVHSDDEVLYRVTFINREIMVNGFRLSKPHFDSENDVVFDYIFKNPGRKIDLAEIEAATKRTLNKKLYDIVRTLGFKNELKDIFFPHVSKTAVKFVNPVTEADFRNRKLREPQLYA
jgi:hypothetical protein